jgi:hypothetical protein
MKMNTWAYVVRHVDMKGYLGWQARIMGWDRIAHEPVLLANKYHADLKYGSTRAKHKCLVWLTQQSHQHHVEAYLKTGKHWAYGKQRKAAA